MEQLPIKKQITGTGFYLDEIEFLIFLIWLEKHNKVKLHHISFFDSTMPSGGRSVRNRCVIRSLSGLTSDLCFSSIVSTGIIVVLTKQPTKEKNSLSTSLSAPNGCSK